MKPTRIRKLAIPSRQRLLGLSLIELMVALGLGVVIVAALSQLFVNISRTNQEMANTNSQIESARFAMQFLQDDIAHAGFWDEYVPQFDDLSLTGIPSDVPGAIPDPCKPYAEWDDIGDADYVGYRNGLLGIPIEITGGAPGTCGALIVNQVPNTDVLVVRHAATCEAGSGHCDDDGTVAGRLYFQPSYCNSDTKVYSLATTYPLRAIDCVKLAPRRKFEQSIYYIRSWANIVGDGIPTLVRSQFDVSGGALAQQPAVALVEGIQAFRVEVGIDDLSEPYTGFPNGSAANPGAAINWLDPDNWETPTNRGDGRPDGDFVHCPTAVCSTADLLNVVAVKVYVLARANEVSQGYTDTKSYTLGGDAIAPFNDGFKRHVFGMTIRLNNVAGRRETP